MYGDAIKHPASSLFTIVSGMLAAVAGISLIVGIIGCNIYVGYGMAE